MLVRMAAIRLSRLTANQTEYLDLKSPRPPVARVASRHEGPIAPRRSRASAVPGRQSRRRGSAISISRVLKLFGRVTEIPASVFLSSRTSRSSTSRRPTCRRGSSPDRRSSSLRTVCFGELGDERPQEVEALLEKIPGAKLDFHRARRPPQAATGAEGEGSAREGDRCRHARPASVDLRKTDLPGVVIEDAFASSWDLRGADLSRERVATLRPLAREARRRQPRGSDVRDCTTDDVTMTKAKATASPSAARELGVDLKNADVRQASPHRASSRAADRAWREPRPGPGAGGENSTTRADRRIGEEGRPPRRAGHVRRHRRATEGARRRRIPRVRWARATSTARSRMGRRASSTHRSRPPERAGAKAPKPLVDERGAEAGPRSHRRHQRGALAPSIDGAAAAAWNGTDEESSTAALDEGRGPF